MCKHHSQCIIAHRSRILLDSMQCFYCRNGYSSRCIRSKLFGCDTLDGGQAEYVRIPDADGTAMKAPSTISDKALVLMADIWPTGFFGARNGFSMLGEEERSNATAVVIGCGPVGLCAIISALEYHPKHIFAVDSVDSRLELAKSLGAEPLNFKTDRVGMEKRIKEVTEGRGADVVIEVVGLSPALRTAFDVVRPWGVISSIGVHNAEVGFNSEAWVVCADGVIDPMDRRRGVQVSVARRCIDGFWR